MLFTHLSVVRSHAGLEHISQLYELSSLCVLLLFDLPQLADQVLYVRLEVLYGLQAVSEITVEKNI